MAFEILEEIILQWKNVKIFTLDPINFFVEKATKKKINRKIWIHSFKNKYILTNNVFTAV